MRQDIRILKTFSNREKQNPSPPYQHSSRIRQNMPGLVSDNGSLPQEDLCTRSRVRPANMPSEDLVQKPNLSSLCSCRGNNSSAQFNAGCLREPSGPWKTMRAALSRLKSGVRRGKDKKVKLPLQQLLSKQETKSLERPVNPWERWQGIGAGSIAKVPWIQLWLPYSPATPISIRQPSFTLPCLRDLSQLKGFLLLSTLKPWMRLCLGPGRWEEKGEEGEVEEPRGVPREVPPSTPTQIPVPTGAAEPQGRRAGCPHSGRVGRRAITFWGLDYLC